MNLRTRFDTATRAGRPSPMHDWTNLKFGFLAASATEVYDNDDNAFRTMHLWLCNTDSVARTVSVWLVPSGAAQGDSHALLKDVSLEAKETLVLPSGIVMNTGDRLFLAASSANVVTCNAMVEIQG